MWHSHLNDMEITETKRFISREFAVGATLSSPIWSIRGRLLFDCTKGAKYLENDIVVSGTLASFRFEDEGEDQV